MFSKLIPTLLLAGLSPVIAAPHMARGTITAAQLLQIAPSSASCAGASFPNECATNEQAAPYINAAMRNYGITSPAEQAALMALIATESGEFKYSVHHFPSPNPGQGTRNMQMAEYNLAYAKSIPQIAHKATYTSVDSMSASQRDELLATVNVNDYSWGTAAWFLTSQKKCAGARSALQASASDQAYTTYLTNCVGTTATAERMEYWNHAKAALGI